MSVGESAVALCGRKTIQISPWREADVDLQAVAQRWTSRGSVVQTPHMVRMKINDGTTVLTLFRSGRALIQGTDDPMVARTIYAQYVGA